MKKYAAVVLLAASLSSQAQKVSNKLSFQKGQKLEMVAETKSMVSQEMMGQSIDMNITSAVTRSFDVEDVSKEGATIGHKVKRVQFSFEGMGQTQSFDSDKEEDRKGEMGKAMEKNIKNKYTMVVDAEGKIVSVKENADSTGQGGMAPDADNPMSGMMAQFAEGLETPKPGDITSLQVLPAGGVTKGQNWTDTAKGDEKGSVTYTVADITAGEVLIDYTSEGAMERTQEAMGMEATISMKTKASGRITVDRKTGLLKQKTINAEGNGNIDVAGQSIPMTTKQTGTIKVNGL